MATASYRAHHPKPSADFRTITIPPEPPRPPCFIHFKVLLLTHKALRRPPLLNWNQPPFCLNELLSGSSDANLLLPPSQEQTLKPGTTERFLQSGSFAPPGALKSKKRLHRFLKSSSWLKSMLKWKIFFHKWCVFFFLCAPSFTHDYVNCLWVSWKAIDDKKMLGFCSRRL